SSTSDLSVDQKVVVKYFPDSFPITHEFNSYTFCAALQGTVIPICYGVFELSDSEGTSPGFFLLLQHVEWKTLGSCDRDFVIEYEHVLLKNCLDAIECIHDNGVTHDDLREENILVDEETGSIKLIDLGSSG